MSSFIRGLGGGIGRVFGRIIGLIVVGVIGYFILNSLNFDLWDFISTRILMNAKAQTQTRDMGNMIYSGSFSPCGLSYNKYCVQTSNNQTATKSLNTTYSGVLNDITFTWQETGSYQTTIVINAMSTDFRNNDFNCNVWGSTQQDSFGTLMSSASCSFISKSKIQVVIPQNSYSYHTIHIWGNPLTGISTYGIKSIVESWDDGTQDTSAITDNATQNTTDIINNANENTTNIISNMRSNAMSQLNSGRKQAITLCKNVYDTAMSYGKTLTNGGAIIDTTNESYYTEDYASINVLSHPNNRVYISGPQNSKAGYYFAFYDSSYTFISGQRTALRNLVIPDNAVYFRFSSPEPTTYIFTEKNGCITADDKIFDVVTSDLIDSGTGADFFNDFDNEDFGLSSIITLPLTTIQSLSSSQCVALELPIPFTNGSTITLPCMAEIYQSKASGIYNLWQIVCYGLIGYWIGTDIFHMVKGFKDPDTDKVEVVDL